MNILWETHLYSPDELHKKIQHPIQSAIWIPKWQINRTRNYRHPRKYTKISWKQRDSMLPFPRLCQSFWYRQPQHFTTETASLWNTWQRPTTDRILPHRQRTMRPHKQHYIWPRFYQTWSPPGKYTRSTTSRPRLGRLHLPTLGGGCDSSSRDARIKIWLVYRWFSLKM